MLTDNYDALISELRDAHPDVTNEQAYIVHLIVLKGMPPAEAARAAGKNRYWLYYNMRRAAVCAYRQAFSIRVLGWDSVAALPTLRSLLNSRSELIRLKVAKDLLNRAGIKYRSAVRLQTFASLVFNLGGKHSAAGNRCSGEPAQVEATLVEMARIDGMGPVGPSPNGEGPLKNEAGFQGRGKHAYD